MYPNQQQSQQQNRPPPPAQREPVSVVGVPSVTVQHGQLIVGNSHSSSTRTYTPLKVVGDGSFGTVWLCDWHGTLPPNTPLSAMQCGAGARPEYANKRLVAVKRMKKRWEGGWDECKRLKELESLRAIPYHPNIIPLYDFFLLPSSKELYFIFESMEGNLYQLIKSRKGRPLAGGLVSSIFNQTISGLHHIHASGYFHRDMKPENLLVTTTGLYDYQPVSPIALPNAPPEKDVVVLIKLADFGLARETKSKPPYTEYVSTRWYRAPEVLLRSRDYSNPVDMWALGTIMAELVNLRPLFPGQGEIDQVARICEVLGDPSDEYGRDPRGRSIGGGKWSKGIKMAKAVGFAFPKIHPKDFYALFDRSVPVKLVDCIADLLRYDPDARLTAKQCIEHPYLLETSPKNNPPILLSSPPPLTVSTASARNPAPPQPQKHAYGNHLQAPGIEASKSHRSNFYSSSSTLTSRTDFSDLPTVASPEQYHTIQTGPAAASSVYSFSQGDRVNRWPDSQVPSNGYDPMDISSPHPDSIIEEYPIANGHPMDIQTSPIAQEYPNRPPVDPEPLQDPANSPHSNVTKLGKFSSLGFGKKSNKWPLSGMFGSVEKQALPPVDELHVASSNSTPSLKRTSSSSGSRSLELSPIHEVPPRILDPKKVKKEAERMAREAEKQRRALAEKTHREQARAVMQKRNQALMQTDRDYLEWKYSANPNQNERVDDHLQSRQVGPIRAKSGHSSGGERSTATLNAAGGRYGDTTFAGWRDNERSAKARRRDLDDDHSMSSSDMASVSRMSMISFATVDSDPGPMLLRTRSSMFGINTRTSTSSLRTSFDDFPKSARSSNSLSLEQQLVSEFHLRASVDTGSSLSDHGSPPPMQRLSLGSPQWQNAQPDTSAMQPRRDNSHSHRSLSPQQTLHPPHSGSRSPYEQLHPPSPGIAPKSAINPIFKVPPNISESRDGEWSSTTLPPFSHLEAVADGEHPPLSPMAFTIPEDVVVQDDG